MVKVQVATENGEMYNWCSEVLCSDGPSVTNDTEQPSDTSATTSSVKLCAEVETQTEPTVLDLANNVHSKVYMDNNFYVYY